MGHRVLLTALATATVVGVLGCGGANTHTRQSGIIPISVPVCCGQRTLHSRLIVLGKSVAGIRLGDPRRRVEKVFGRGKSRRRGLVWYFRGHLLVNYWVHDGLQKWVGDLETTWPGFHTRSGIHVGSSRGELRALHIPCRTGECAIAARPEPPPDAPGTIFTMHHGKVAKIDVFYG